jgi:hypothetical protein
LPLAVNNNFTPVTTGFKKLWEFQVDTCGSQNPIAKSSYPQQGPTQLQKTPLHAHCASGFIGNGSEPNSPMVAVLSLTSEFAKPAQTALFVCLQTSLFLQ